MILCPLFSKPAATLSKGIACPLAAGVTQKTVSGFYSSLLFLIIVTKIFLLYFCNRVIRIKIK